MAAALPGWQVARYIDRTNIADGDQPIFSHEPRRLLVQMPTSGIGNLGVLQAEIDADLSGTAVSVFLDFALQAEIPAPASVGGKAPSLDLAFDRAAQPDAIRPPQAFDYPHLDGGN